MHFPDRGCVHTLQTYSTAFRCST